MQGDTNVLGMRQSPEAELGPANLHVGLCSGDFIDHAYAPRIAKINQIGTGPLSVWRGDGLCFKNIFVGKMGQINKWPQS